MAEPWYAGLYRFLTGAPDPEPKIHPPIDAPIAPPTAVEPVEPPPAKRTRRRIMPMRKGRKKRKE